MRPWKPICLMILAMAITATASGQNWSEPPGDDSAGNPEAGVVAATKATTIDSAGVSLKASAKRLRDRPGFTWKKRRELGLTIPNMIRKLAEMDKAGELDGLDQSEVAVQMMGQLRGDNPKVFATEASLDPAFWSRLLKFIQFILPLLLLFI